MIAELVQLVILFTVIFDPFASLAVFYTGITALEKKEKQKIAGLAILVALVLSYSVVILGNRLLQIFNTTIDEFKIAGGIILCLLGIRMAMGYPLMNLNNVKNNSSKAIAAIIGTPLLTGPAAITTIIITTKEYGAILPSIAIGIVLIFTAVLFYIAATWKNFFGETLTQVISTVLGLIIIAWGVKFITTGIMAIFLL